MIVHFSVTYRVPFLITIVYAIINVVVNGDSLQFQHVACIVQQYFLYL